MGGGWGYDSTIGYTSIRINLNFLKCGICSLNTATFFFCFFDVTESFTGFVLYFK